jgi:hypothetical protein
MARRIVPDKTRCTGGRHCQSGVSSTKDLGRCTSVAQSSSTAMLKPRQSAGKYELHVRTSPLRDYTTPNRSSSAIATATRARTVDANSAIKRRDTTTLLSLKRRVVVRCVRLPPGGPPGIILVAVIQFVIQPAHTFEDSTKTGVVQVGERNPFLCTHGSAPLAHRRLAAVAIVVEVLPATRSADEFTIVRFLSCLPIKTL